jgi:hypothetical protein
MWSPMLTSLGASSCAFCPSSFSAFPSDSSFSSVPGFFDPEEKVEGAVREKERSGGMERESERARAREGEREGERERVYLEQ